MRARKLPIILGCIFLLAIGAIAGRRALADQVGEPLAEFKGLFTGDTVSNDGARRKITLDIQQNGNQFKGTYSCAAGNATCRNRITRGWVSGTIDARNFRVSLQDSSWCAYRLGAFYLNGGEGEYTCYAGAGIVEQGAFQITRVRPQ